MWNELPNLHQRGYAEVTDGWLSAVDVEDHVKRGMLRLEEVISQEEIMDKGKADWVVNACWDFRSCGSACNVSREQFNISPSPRWRSALSHTSHLCSSLCGVGGISHTTSMSLPHRWTISAPWRSAPHCVSCQTGYSRVSAFAIPTVRPRAGMFQGYREWPRACA
jgi:hypothetical protein